MKRLRIRCEPLIYTLSHWRASASLIDRTIWLTTGTLGLCSKSHLLHARVAARLLHQCSATNPAGPSQAALTVNIAVSLRKNARAILAAISRRRFVDSGGKFPRLLSAALRLSGIGRGGRQAGCRFGYGIVASCVLDLEPLRIGHWHVCCKSGNLRSNEAFHNQTRLSMSATARPRGLDFQFFGTSTQDSASPGMVCAGAAEDHGRKSNAPPEPTPIFITIRGLRPIETAEERAIACP